MDERPELAGDERQRLAAILAADAVGYSRLMESDEHGTARALAGAHDVFRAQAAAHRGRIVNTVGDSVLAIFASATGAVAAAVGTQHALAELASDVPEARRLRFRVGVHLGDVGERADGDVYGDGVNIAARLQALAPAGGIVVSESVRGAVKARVPVTYRDLGPQRVKNIAEPVHAFAIGDLGAVPRDRVRTPRRWRAVAAALVVCGVVAAAATWWGHRSDSRPATVAVAPPPAAAPAGKPSIAVLPFDNLSAAPDQSYFADGITEDLITDLSKVGGLVVIARNSTFQYKGKARDAREIGKVLGARYLLEGSVRRNGDQVRVNAQLIDAVTGAHVWADRFDGTHAGIFALQETIARAVVKALAVEITGDESQRVANRGTGNAQAYDVFLRGWQHYLHQTPDEFRAAIADFRNATKIDPSYARAWAALAAVYWESYTRYWAEAVGLPRHSNFEAEQFLSKAMRDPVSLAYQVRSAMLLHNGQHEAAIGEAQRGIANDPNDADAYAALAGALTFAGRPTEGLDAIERAMKLNPHFPSTYAYQRGLALFALGRLPEAAASLERAVEINADDYWSKRLLLAVYGLTGQRDKTTPLIAAMTSGVDRGRWASYDPLNVRGVAYWFPFARADDAKRLATGLAKAGVPE